MCDCGCNTCETKSNALLLNENKAPKAILSEGLKHHIDNNKPLTEHLYRAGSRAYFDLFAEARSLYSRGILEFTHEDDIALLTETHLGHFGVFEGEAVPLDFPILEGEEYYVTYNKGRGQGKGLVKSKESDYEEPRIFSKEEAEEYVKRAKSGGSMAGQITAWWVSDRDMNRIEEAYEVGGKMVQGDLSIGGKKVKAIHHNNSKNVEDHEIEYEDGTKEPYLKHIIKEVIRENKMPSQEEVDKFFSITNNETHYLYSKPVKGQKGDRVRSEIEPWDEYDLSNYKSLVRKYKENRPLVSESKKKKKGPKLNKPMRSSSGGKAYKVYVKDPKTKKVKTVRFGSGGLRAKINDSKARKAFAARHKCSQKKDRTKASYWSCRLPRYAKLLGLKSSFSGFW